ncbi:histidine phosphatase family protein [Paucilactobacillus wasatchensis]|uniref:Phosphoglycerate mutase family n=1 Tax=Paucilactobacillus wasatchensis TaxID=1335616 RepID=A0A0D1A7B7_9LACO|nr:histidine phosphatase family protein [Paucilactobacillus wasatchensis]KIS02581.1 Phosphoglycerate mutase family [Paucilactobacillus wasatchensis]
MANLTVYIVRHGETLLNTFKRMQGWCDSDLTKQGRQDAIKAGQSIHAVHFDYSYSSDLKRAIDTKNLILQQLDHAPGQTRVERNFREVSFGYFEGLPSATTWKEVGQTAGYSTQAEIIADKGLAKAQQLMHLADPTGLAETNQQILGRWRAGITQIRNECAGGTNILLVTHGTFIRTLADYHHINTLNNYPKNGSISILKLSDNASELMSYNE